jgi:multiple sugar transport system substrate-binding protein
MLQEWLASPGQPAVATTILPFARATSRFRSALEEGQCPDLLRIDATRIPGLVDTNTIAVVPPNIWSKHDWLPEAEALVREQGELYGIPQSLDGLALVRRRRAEQNWPASSLQEWLLSLQSKERKPSLGILLDGYWFVAFLRSTGGSLPDAKGEPPVNSPEAQAGLNAFAALFRDGIAMYLLEERAPSRAMVKAFRQGQLEEVFTGPWDLLDLSGGKLDELQVGALPGGNAPRGGQVLVVPRCAPNAAGAWALASALTDPALQSQWARRLGTVPVTASGLEDAGQLVNEFYRALQEGRPLPRHVRVPELFDDLTPAVVAVVSGDASAEEALAGVGRAWTRLYNLPTNVPVPSLTPLTDASPRPPDAGDASLPRDAGSPP